MHRRIFTILPLALLLLLTPAKAEISAFDLAGPTVDLKVERAGFTLPVAEVPSLRVGDRLWIHPALPQNQSIRYLLIVAFLRGSTNPPPETWFTRAETWRKNIREEGIFIKVPDTAEQAVIFLAPETMGDFGTLRSAVRGRPGSFVRAIQDLQQASLDRSRLDTYLAAMRQAAAGDAATVHDRSMLLARSLGIRLDEDCYKKVTDQQAACLTQKSDTLVLNDGHSISMVGSLTQGPASDLIGQITYTPVAGSGYFSPYVGAIVDMARILDSLHTAQYQYIPALGLPKQDQLQLKLNTAPSFHNPKSVIVVALPPIRQDDPPPPPLRAIDSQQASCIQKPPLVLSVSGAPLAFSTTLLHNVVLHLLPAASHDSAGGAPEGAGIDLPAAPDPVRGGYIVDTRTLPSAGQEIRQGVLRGYWGFEPWTGPVFKLQSAHSVAWKIPLEETTQLLAGREHSFDLHADAAACVDQISLQPEPGVPEHENAAPDWTVSDPAELRVRIAAVSAKPGNLTLAIHQAGLKQPDDVRLKIYAETGVLDQFVIIEGDPQAVLHGSRLDDVAGVEWNGIHFKPSARALAGQQELPCAAENSAAPLGISPESKQNARVVLKDGRNVDVPVTVESPRPSVGLLSKRVVLGPESALSAVHLIGQDQLPLDGRLSFSLKTGLPKIFPRGEKIEIAAADDSVRVLLSIADGSLVLQDRQTVLATLDPAKSFGNSAFGPLRFRPVDERGVKGDWQSLATLVRLPVLVALHCPDDAAEPCILSGSDLFLLDSVAADPGFTNAVSVPGGFVDMALNVPHPTGPTLYLKLRDNPNIVNIATISLSPGN